MPPFLLAVRFLVASAVSLRPVHREVLAREELDFTRWVNQNLEITKDWFSHNIPTWSWALEKYLTTERSELRFLEIGSFEGLSANYINRKFPGTVFTCVDTWSGSPEHYGGRGSAPIDFDEVRARFDKNTTSFKGRVSVFQGTSISFFAGIPATTWFDLIYVDGSHNSDDVLLDAVLSLKLLKPGGILIFDDYLWDVFDDPRETPRAGIDAFLALKSREIQLIYFGYQVIIQKL